MKQECLDLIGQTLAREVSNTEGNNIIAALKVRMTRLSKSYEYRDKWDSMSLQERIVAAGASIAQEISDAAKAKKAARYKQVIAQNQIVRELDRLAREDDIHAYSGVAQVLLGVERNAKGIQNEYLSNMLDTLNGIKSKWLGFVEDDADVRGFVQEVFGEDSKNDRAKAAAQAWLKTSEAMRSRAKAAGAEIGRIRYGYIPQSHDWWRIRKVGKDAWIRFTMPLMDRSKFINDNGRPMVDAELMDLLAGSYDDIVMSGNTTGNLFEAAELVPEFNVSRYKKYPHRELHFKDSNSFLAYEQRFGKGSLTSTLIGHVAKMSHDIAIMENMGPRAQATFAFMKSLAEAQALNARGTASKTEMIRKYSDWQGLTGASIDAMWNVLSGKAGNAAVNSEGVAEFMSGWRNLEVAGKLGKAFISSFSDIPSYFIATGFNRLDFGQGLRFLFSAYGRDWKDYAARAGLIADSLASDFNRWAGDNIGQGWTSKMANATMKASFLEGFTDATRRAFGLNMMASLAKMSKKSWTQLDDYDRARLQQGGIDERTWELIREAGTETHNGIEFVTANTVKRLTPTAMVSQDEINALPGKLIGFIVSEGEMASLNPDLVTRAEATRGMERGTFGGELMRALYLFKSFPIAMMEKHYRRVTFLNRHGSMVDSLGYAASIALTTTIFGAISLEVQNLLNGKDLQNANPIDNPQFWLEAMAKGGGLGFLGDWLANGLSEDARYGAMSGLTNFAGPQIGTFVDVFDLTTAALGSAVYDKDTKPAAKSLRLVRSHLPFLNMWYASSAIDRAFMNEINEYLSPGYLEKMEKRTRRGTGQGYWWNPNSLVPGRAPEVATPPQK